MKPMHLAAGIAVLALMLVLPHLIYPVFLMKMLCFALFACAFNLLIGYVGLLSFGHAAYFGGGAYIAAHLIKVGTVYVPFVGTFALPPVTPEIGILLGATFSGLLGFVFGSLAIRRQGIYFAMITLALAEMFFLFCVQAPFTHNEDGIQAVPRTAMFGVIDTTDETVLYYIVLVIFLIGFGIVYRTVHSPFGQVLKAIRENEPRAISLGYKTDQYKLLAFILSGTLATMMSGAVVGMIT
jgi:branched-chain amino acid transport system permease protein